MRIRNPPPNRAGGRWAHLLLALAVVAGVFVQVYLIGVYIFGAGQRALDAHKTAGWTVHGLLLAAIGTVQVALANEQRWVGGMHPLLALVVVGLAAVLALPALRRSRETRLLRRGGSRPS